MTTYITLFTSFSVNTLERLLLLISGCAVVWRTLAGYGGKLEAPVVKRKSFELERKGGNFFQVDGTVGTNGLSFFALEGKIEQRI